MRHTNSDSSPTINNYCRISRNVNCFRICENSFLPTNIDFRFRSRAQSIFPQLLGPPALCFHSVFSIWRPAVPTPSGVTYEGLPPLNEPWNLLSANAEKKEGRNQFCVKCNSKMRRKKVIYTYRLYISVNITNQTNKFANKFAYAKHLTFIN